MSTAYIIYDKYANAINNELLETGRRDSIHIDAVRLALRLALAELAESGPSISPTLSTEKDRQRHEFERLQINSQLRIDELEQEINSLYDWLDEHMPVATLVPASTAGAVLAVLDQYRLRIEALEKEAAELRQQLAQLDADNAALIRRNKELSDELKHARLDRQESAFSGISATITDHPNGTAVTIAPAPINHQITLDYSSLSSENVDWCDGLDADRQQWRHLPKRTRLELVRWILSHDAAMTMAAFDAIRPEWMPTAGSHCKTFNVTWEQLNDFTVDLEVTR